VGPEALRPTAAEWLLDWLRGAALLRAGVSLEAFLFAIF
jgi:hypothetical protein